MRAWLARLETEAAVLPEERRIELRASVEDYLADAARDAGPDGGRAAERAIAELGSPAALVAEAGGYALSPVDALDPAAEDDDPHGDPVAGGGHGDPARGIRRAGPRAGDRGVRAGAVVRRHPARAALAPVERRRQGAWPCWRSACWACRCLLLGRDELPTAASLVVAVLLVAFWVAAAARLLVRARAPREQGFGLRMR